LLSSRSSGILSAAAPGLSNMALMRLSGRLVAPAAPAARGLAGPVGVVAGPVVAGSVALSLTGSTAATVSASSSAGDGEGEILGEGDGEGEGEALRVWAEAEPAQAHHSTR
jgi:hypothetical protein